MSDAGEPGLDPLDRLAQIVAADEADGEVDPLGEPLGLRHPPAQHALDVDRLEIGAAALDEHGHLAVVHRHLGDAGGLRPEPEDQAPAALADAAVAIADHMMAGVAAQLREQAEIADVGHGHSPF